MLMGASDYENCQVPNAIIALQLDSQDSLGPSTHPSLSRVTCGQDVRLALTPAGVHILHPWAEGGSGCPYIETTYMAPSKHDKNLATTTVSDNIVGRESSSTYMPISSKNENAAIWGYPRTIFVASGLSQEP